MTKPSQITTLKACEQELDRALADLRKLSAGGTNSNVLAAASHRVPHRGASTAPGDPAMMADRTYRRVHFPPADTCALGPVKVLGPDGELIRVIPVEALRKRPSAVPEQHATVIAPREQYPEYRAVKRRAR